MSKPRNSKMITQQAFVSFSKISDFVGQLAEIFGDRFHEVNLYNHILVKTKLINKPAVQRHITLFEEFCRRNQDAIINKDPAKIMHRVISYSDKVFIDLYAILTSPGIDKETTDTCWNHLLVIQATIDPSSEAREILRKLKEDASSTEGQFLGDFLEKIKGSVDPEKEQTPMAAAASLIQGGALTDLMGGMAKGVQEGTLDIGKLMGTMQQVLGSLSSQMGDGSSGGGAGNPMAGLNLGGLMGNVMSMMQNAGGLPSTGGDPSANPMAALSAIFGGQGGVAGGMAGLDPEKMQAKIEAEVAVEKKKLEDEEAAKQKATEKTMETPD